MSITYVLDSNGKIEEVADTSDLPSFVIAALANGTVAVWGGCAYAPTQEQLKRGVDL